MSNACSVSRLQHANLAQVFLRARDILDLLGDVQTLLQFQVTPEMMRYDYEWGGQRIQRLSWNWKGKKRN